MHSPRQRYLPRKVVLEPLYKVDKLIDKSLVTSIHICPAYSMYLSDKCTAHFYPIVPYTSLIHLGDTAGENLSLALVAQVPVAGVAGLTAGGGSGFTWWADAQTGIHRKACDETGNYTFTPLFSLKRQIKRNRRWIRDTIRPDPTGDDLSVYYLPPCLPRCTFTDTRSGVHGRWYDHSPPWDPLDEDGEEDEFDPVRMVFIISFIAGFSQHGIPGNPRSRSIRRRGQGRCGKGCGGGGCSSEARRSFGRDLPIIGSILFNI